MASSSAAPSQLESDYSRSSSVAWYWLFAFATVVIYLSTTGTLPLLGRDEPRYVEVAREMLRTGDWITPTLGGTAWFEKPALLYWLVAASFTAFGVSEWSARVAPTFCGLAIIYSIYWAARPTGKDVARWAAVTVGTSGALLAFSFCATFDIVLTAAVTLALCAFAVSLEADQEHRRRFLAIFWVGVGLAFLAKGLVAFILTIGTVWLYALIRKERIHLGFFWGLLLCLLVSAVWYLPVTLHNGSTFINEFFVQHHFQRYLSDKFKHHQPPYFYLKILPLLALPWTPVFLLCAGSFRKVQFRAHTPAARLQALGLAWTLVPVLFFSVSGSKLPGYILPAVPGLFLFAAPTIADWAAVGRRSWALASVAVLFLLVRPVVAVIGPSLQQLDENSIRALLDSPAARDHQDLRLVEYRLTERAPQFYASGQLLYDPSTKDIMRLKTPEKLAASVALTPLLVLTSQHHLAELRSCSLLHVKLVATQGKFDLLSVSARS